MIGKTLGKYRILAAIGRGGMGTVYKAVDETIGREVAVKVLTPEMLHGDALTQFEAEAGRLAALNHPQVAALHEIYHAPKDVLMVMELVQGETLDQILVRSGPLPVPKAAYLVSQILSALSHAHAAGIVHRDLKPSNVMVTEGGGVKLLDFGTSRISSAALMTAIGPAFGASAYMAPERILGSEVDSRADLYSVAVLFYRLLTGTLPFEATAVADLIQKQLTGAPRSARSQRADVPEWCEQLLERALAKSPEARFQTAEEFKAGLLSGAGSLDDEGAAVFAVPPQAPDVPATVLAPIPGGNTASAPQPASAVVAPPPAPTSIPAALAPEPAPVAAPLSLSIDPLAATLALPLTAADPLAPTLLAPIPAADPPATVPAVPAGKGTSLPVAPTLAAPTGGVTSLANAPAVDPLAATLAAPIPEVVSLPPTLMMPLGGVPPVPAAALAPTLAAPVPAPIGYESAPGYTTAGWAPTAATPVGALAPTELAPSPTLPPGPTLVMERKHFAAAGLLLTTLALGVVILAVIVLRRPAEVVMAPSGSSPTAGAAAGATTQPTPAPEAPAASAPPPTAILDPPIRPTAVAPPPNPPLVSASVSSASQPSAGAAASADKAGGAAGGTGTLARPTNTMPFVFDARAVVSEDGKHREREANVLVADGALKVSQKDDKPLFVVALADVTGLTYSNSKQPLWNSPSGPAEAMRVDGGAFGFLKGGRNNWFGIRTTSSLLVLRVDDSTVARVIAGLQERIGLPVARLIEPKE